MSARHAPLALVTLACLALPLGLPGADASEGMSSSYLTQVAGPTVSLSGSAVQAESCMYMQSNVEFQTVEPMDDGGLGITVELDPLSWTEDGARSSLSPVVFELHYFEMPTVYQTLVGSGSQLVINDSAGLTSVSAYSANLLGTQGGFAVSEDVTLSIPLDPSLLPLEAQEIQPPDDIETGCNNPGASWGLGDTVHFGGAP
jgi:hypothetical protein